MPALSGCLGPSAVTTNRTRGVSTLSGSFTAGRDSILQTASGPVVVRPAGTRDEKAAVTAAIRAATNQGSKFATMKGTLVKVRGQQVLRATSIEVSEMKSVSGGKLIGASRCSSDLMLQTNDEERTRVLTMKPMTEEAKEQFASLRGKLGNELQNTSFRGSLNETTNVMEVWEVLMPAIGPITVQPAIELHPDTFTTVSP